MAHEGANWHRESRNASSRNSLKVEGVTRLKAFVKNLVILKNPFFYDAVGEGTPTCP